MPWERMALEENPLDHRVHQQDNIVAAQEMVCLRPGE